MISNKYKYHLLELAYAMFATLAGAAVIHLGMRLLNVNFDYFYGIGTFSPFFVLSLFLLPFLAGIVVAVIYGLGAKIVAHASPLVVLIPNYLAARDSAAGLEGAVSILPLGYWLLLVIVAAEFASLGGFAGEAMIKKTYGRRPKEQLHKRYQVGIKARVSDLE